MKMRLFFIMFLMFGLQNMAHAGTCSTLPTRIYNSCNLGYYYEPGECISCAGLVQRQNDDNFANGTKGRDCPARAGTGAGGQHGSEYCAFPNSDCGDWEYNCNSGYYLDGDSCESCSGVTFTETDTSIANGSRSRTCYRTGGAGGTSDSDSCTGSANCGSWTYDCDDGCSESSGACVCDEPRYCDDGYYFDETNNSCYACSGVLASETTTNISYGTRTQTCYYTGGAGGQLDSSHCTGSSCTWECDCVYGANTTGENCSCPSEPVDCGDNPSGSSVTDCKQQGYSGWNSSTTCCTGTAGSCDYCTDSDDCSGSQVCSGNCCKTISCKACTSNSDCGSLQTCNLSTGCCVFSGGGGDTTTCTERTCTSDDNCNFGETCVNGYCYRNGTGTIIATSCNKLTCDTGTSCQETLTSGTYACLPDCGTGAYFVGATATCSCRSCPIMDDAWDGDNSLLAGTTASAGYGPGGITSCYIPAGTYYDDNGTFVFDADCPYTASDTGGDSGTTECASNADCALLYGSHYICDSGSCVLKFQQI